MPFRDGMSYEDFVGKRGYERMGKQPWRNAVIEVAAILRAGLIAGAFTVLPHPVNKPRVHQVP